MEEGSLRCDANVSVRTAGASAFGTKAEVKNINSFRFLQKALEYEIGRQIDVVEGGSEVVQETRLWDASRGVTHSMRSKEEAHDYRYFPEPDLPPLVVTRDRVEALRQEMPELPDTRQQRFVDAYALPAYDAAQLTQARDVADFFESTIRAGAPPKLVSNWMMGELTRVLNALGRDVSRSPVSPERLAGLLALVETGEISGAIAKSVFEKMLESEQTAADIVRTQGLAQIDDDSTIIPAIERVLESNADAVEQYRGGKTATLGFLVGQVMRATGGKANPKRVNELLRAALEGQ
jgi:aspartyl-tRNA(Asn)/glutamyl-tRNA(Gln) amidotransferase subunit B